MNTKTPEKQKEKFDVYNPDKAIMPGKTYFIILTTTIILLLFVNYNKQAPRIIKPWWIIYVCYPLHLILFAIIKYLIDY